MRRVLWLLILLLWPVSGAAQGAATLVADSVRLNGEDQLIATGNVAVLFEGSRLTAREILYDRPTDSLTITGPIFIRLADDTLLTADTATLDPRLENGILQGARLVLDQQLQFAATQIDRRDGRFIQLFKTSATSCRVCGTGPPLWEIRAERVTSDREERQVYFRNATFHVRGLPVFWLPFLRLPEPGLERATGFLVPEQRNTTQLGSGLKWPYFIALGDHRDITLIPYFSPQTRTLEWRYRQAFATGNLHIEGAISDDTLRSTLRNYAFMTGSFDLPDRYQLSFDIETSSDSAYVRDYGYTGKDRLDSALTLLRVDQDSQFQARATYFESLRDNETNASLPPIIADTSYQARRAAAFGGTLSYEVGLDAAYRPSDGVGDQGRDVARAGVAGAWQDSWVSNIGIVTAFEVGARADTYFVRNDNDFDKTLFRAAPSTGLTLRWPLARQTQSGAAHVLEPTAYIGWAQDYGDDTPNEDSTRSELDRANLLNPSRFAGEDAVQTGPQAAVGLTWSRFGPAGGTSTFNFGRVFTKAPDPRFTASSGLGRTQSDWLLAAQVTTADGFLADGRSLWSDRGELNSADGRVAWRNEWIMLRANYNWQLPDANEGRAETVSEWTLDGAVEVSDAWTLELDARYNVAEDQPVSTGAGLQWRNECVTIDFSASRSFASSGNVEPTTTLGLSGSIGSFTTGRRGGAIATGCGN